MRGIRSREADPIPAEAKMSVIAPGCRDANHARRISAGPPSVVIPRMRKRIRAIALASQTRIAVTAAVWLSLFAYAGRPLLAGAAAAGLTPAFAWSALVAFSVLPFLPRVMRRGTRAHWTGYATLAVFSTLLVLVLIGDVLRAGYHLARWAISAQTWPMLDPRAVSLTILGAAGALSLVGLLQARYPRTRRVTI